MGSSFGKFTLPTVEDKIKSETASEPLHAEPIKETASQPDTWKESSHIQTATTDPTAKCTPNGDQSVANGTVASTDSAVEADHCKKKKNPLGWIKRRLSKKSSEARRPSADQTAVTEDFQTTVQERPEEKLAVPDTQASSDQASEKQTEITDAAISLVDEVLLSAIASQTSEVVENSATFRQTNVESQVPSEQLMEEQLITSTDPEPIPQRENEPVSHEPTPEVQTYALNGDHRDEEAADCHVDADHSCTDVEERPSATEPEPVAIHLDNEAIISKLAGMESTNGHSHDLINGGDFDSEEMEHSESVH